MKPFTFNGVSFEKLQNLKAVAQRHCIFDPILVSQYVFERQSLFENCKQTAENSKQMYASQMHFGCTNMWSKVYHF